MLRWLQVLYVSASLAAAAGSSAYQDKVEGNHAAQDKEPKYEFYSGSVSKLEKDKVTVLRTIPGKPEESKTFAIKETTIVEGKLEMDARVTVGYVTEELYDIAVRIIVREAQ